MKNTEEIIRRAVCLLCFSDRCFLEKDIIDGIQHTLDEREEQRKLIRKWLIEKNYYDYLSKKEKMIIDLPVVERKNIMVLAEANDYECIEPLLWSVGLVPELSSYDYYVVEDLHPILKIGRDHSLKEIVDSCKPLSSDLIETKRELAMLWYQQSLECHNHSNDINSDLRVKGKKLSTLSNKKLAELTMYSKKRFHAFEWMCSNDDWKNVNLD